MEPAKERVYVRVASEFDATGYMLPKAIIWKDGRTFPIEGVRQFRPAGAEEGAYPDTDCYIVLIHGQEKQLFFSKNKGIFRISVGRWFVERSAAT